MMFASAIPLAESLDGKTLSGPVVSMAREAMVRARGALRTASLDTAEDLALPARQYVIGKRIAELTEALAALDLEAAKAKEPTP